MIGPEKFPLYRVDQVHRQIAEYRGLVLEGAVGRTNVSEQNKLGYEK